jgi:hypothetical protein
MEAGAQASLHQPRQKITIIIIIVAVNIVAAGCGPAAAATKSFRHEIYELAQGGLFGCVEIVEENETET